MDTDTNAYSPRVADTTIFEGDGGSYHSWSSSNFPLLGESLRFVLEFFFCIHMASLCPTIQIPIRLVMFFKRQRKGPVCVANGEKLLDATVKAGELFVVPRFVVAIEIADAQGMEYLSVITSSREDYGQVDFAALEQLENPDLHVDSVRTMNLFRKIKELMAALDCPKKFNLRDLIKPDADRTELFLSALLNFCIHR
ncbi:hypothetical protein C3L33_18711, partial [Rhododendron williamsianum]